MFDRLRALVGGSLVAREMHLDRLWAARPLHVLTVEQDLLVAQLTQGSTWLRPAKPDGASHRVPEEPWALNVETWPYDNLWFVPAGAPFAVHTIRRTADAELLGWYVNVQEPIRPTAAGFDYLDHTLDVIVSPDLSSVELKDEDELAWGVEIGLYSTTMAADIRAAADDGVTWLRQHHELLSGWAETRQRRRAPLDLDLTGVDGILPR